MIDLGPAADEMAALLSKITDDQLSARTPCPEYSLGDLIDHVNGLSQAFTAAALKQPIDATPSGDASRLDPDWRTRIPEHLAALALAWRSPAAWEGMTAAGGVDLPGEVAGRVALNELVVHGWDIARASDQTYTALESSVLGALEFVATVPSSGPAREGLFGPAVEVREDAPAVVKLLGLTGRDPFWR